MDDLELIKYVSSLRHRFLFLRTIAPHCIAPCLSTSVGTSRKFFARGGFCRPSSTDGSEVLNPEETPAASTSHVKIDFIVVHSCGITA